MTDSKTDLSKINKRILTALKKAHSHLENVIQMVEGEEYCVDILQQNLAVIGLLKSANSKLLERHLANCFADAMRGTNENRKRIMIEEILTLENLSK